MSEAEETRSQTDDEIDEPIDLRGELKRALAEEFNTALLSQTALTAVQREALIETVEARKCSAESLLKLLGSAEDEYDERESKTDYV